MAEGWAKELKGDEFDPYSAGTHPHGLNHFAVKVMAEAGVDISDQKSKHLDEFRDLSFAYVVTVCDSANEACPIFPGNAIRVHKSFDDPPRLAKDAKSEEETLGHYRRVRDQIREFVSEMPESFKEGEL
jgi:arsenate reductase